MFDFYERRKIRQWLYSWPMVVFLCVVVIVLGHAVWDIYQQAYKTKANKDRQMAHLAELEEREAALQEEIDRLNTERGVEAEIRQKYEVAKEGEHVIVIVDTPEGADDGDKARTGFWSTLIDTLVFWK